MNFEMILHNNMTRNLNVLYFKIRLLKLLRMLSFFLLSYMRTFSELGDFFTLVTNFF